MSETEDRMERAERIREMRQSRERDDGGTATEPADATAEPTDATAEPADTATEPVETATKPTDTGTEPAETAMEPAETATEPADTGTEPANGSVESADAVASGGTSDDEAAEASSVAQSSTAGDVAADVGGDTDVAGPSTSDASGTVDGNGAGTVADGAAAAVTGSADGLAPLGGSSGFSLADDEPVEEGGDEADRVGERAAGTARSRGGVAPNETSVRVLEFSVGEQIYCIDIDRVEEIVKRETVTRVPNTDDYVEGVVDLRGQITTVLDTRRLLDVESAGSESLLVIFAPDAFEEHGSVGWVVDDVRQVDPVAESQVRTPPAEDEHVRGIVDRDEGDDLVVWIRPGRAMSQAVDVADIE